MPRWARVITGPSLKLTPAPTRHCPRQGLGDSFTHFVHRNLFFRTFLGCLGVDCEETCDSPPVSCALGSMPGQRNDSPRRGPALAMPLPSRLQLSAAGLPGPKPNVPRPQWRSSSRTSNPPASVWSLPPRTARYGAPTPAPTHGRASEARARFRAARNLRGKSITRYGRRLASAGLRRYCLPKAPPGRYFLPGGAAQHPGPAYARLSGSVHGVGVTGLSECHDRAGYSTRSGLSQAADGNRLHEFKVSGNGGLRLSLPG